MKIINVIAQYAWYDDLTSDGHLLGEFSSFMYRNKCGKIVTWIAALIIRLMLLEIRPPISWNAIRKI